MILPILLKFESIEKRYLLSYDIHLSEKIRTDNFEIFNTDAYNRQDQSCPWI